MAQTGWQVRAFLVRLKHTREPWPTLLCFVIPMSRPKHPTSAYNLFFQYERYRLLENLTTLDAPTIDPGMDEDEDEFAARRRYTVITAADVDKAQKYSSERAKRKKSEGESVTDISGGTDTAIVAPKASLGFADLARTVAVRWKTLDKSNKAVFEERAWIDKSRYQVQLYVWRRDRAAREAEQERLLQEYKRQKMNPPGVKAPLPDNARKSTAAAAALASEAATLRKLHAKHSTCANSFGCTPH
jgi:hypothetical protein